MKDNPGIHTRSFSINPVFVNIEYQHRNIRTQELQNSHRPCPFYTSMNSILPAQKRETLKTWLGVSVLSTSIRKIHCYRRVSLQSWAIGLSRETRNECRHNLKKDGRFEDDERYRWQTGPQIRCARIFINKRTQSTSVL